MQEMRKCMYTGNALDAGNVCRKCMRGCTNDYKLMIGYRYKSVMIKYKLMILCLNRYKSMIAKLNTNQ